MLAGRLFGQEDLRIVSMPIPETGEQELLIRVKAAAVCGTDLRMIKQGVAGMSESHPLTLGHEFSGIIERVGPATGGTYQVGQRVAVAPNFGCGTCDFCVSGQGHMCPDYQAFGINLDGAFAEFVRVPAKAVLQGNVTPIADNVPFAVAALNEPLSCVYNGFERNHVRQGDTVLIIGAGAIGIMHAMLARMAGAAKVVINDLSDQRLEIVHAIDPGILTVNGQADLAEYTRMTTVGKGFDVIVTAAPVPQIQQDSLKLAAVNGRICFFGGLPRDRENVVLNTNLIHYKQLIVSGTTRANLRQYRQTLDFIAAGLVQVDRLITNRGDISMLPDFIKEARLANGLKYVVEFA
ncbi:MAG TPA: alcohol dehydrogenase catalytic domain-containing protein [Clostridia bacterium]